MLVGWESVACSLGLYINATINWLSNNGKKTHASS